MKIAIFKLYSLVLLKIYSKTSANNELFFFKESDSLRNF